MKISKWLFISFLIVVFTVVLFAALNFRAILKGPLDTRKFGEDLIESDFSKELSKEANEKIKLTLEEELEIEFEENIFPNEYLRNQIDNLFIGVHGYLFSDYEHLPKIHIEPIKERIVELIIEIIIEKQLSFLENKQAYFMSTNNQTFEDIYKDIVEKHGKEFFNKEEVNLDEVKDIVESYDLDIDDEKVKKEIASIFVEENIKELEKIIGFEIDKNKLEEVIDDITNSEKFKTSLKNNSLEIIKKSGILSNIEDDFDFNVFNEELTKENINIIEEIKDMIKIQISATSKVFLIVLVPLLLLILILAYQIREIMIAVLAISGLQTIALLFFSKIDTFVLERLRESEVLLIDDLDNFQKATLGFIQNTTKTYQDKLLVYGIVSLIIFLACVLLLVILSKKLNSWKENMLIVRIAAGLVLFLLIPVMVTGFVKRTIEITDNRLDRIEMASNNIENQDIQRAVFETLGIDTNALSEILGILN